MMSVYVGIAGWSYPDWEGIVYPKPKPRGFDPLEYVASYLDAVEINNTFYRIPLKKNAETWVRRIGKNPRFKFTLKLWQGFTHGDVSPYGSEAKEFLRGIEPIFEIGRLGAVLVQFPWSFKNVPQSRQKLEGIVETFANLPLVCEFRHVSWERKDVIDFLSEKGVGFCNIDQPQFRGSLKPTSFLTSRVGYIRFHGRNKEEWFKEDAEGYERYNYLYSLDELKSWMGIIKEISSKAQETFIITNNHYRGKGFVNALELKSLLGEPVNPPEILLENYREYMV